MPLQHLFNIVSLNEHAFLYFSTAGYNYFQLSLCSPIRFLLWQHTGIQLVITASIVLLKMLYMIQNEYQEYDAFRRIDNICIGKGGDETIHPNHVNSSGRPYKAVDGGDGPKHMHIFLFPFNFTFQINICELLFAPLY